MNPLLFRRSGVFFFVRAATTESVIWYPYNAHQSEQSSPINLKLFMHFLRGLCVLYGQESAKRLYQETT